MQTEPCQTIPLSLETVNAKFKEWRTSKQNNNITTAKIPNDLWEQVSKLFDHYSLAKIRKTLNLNPRQLKSRFQKYRNNKNPGKTIKAQ